MTAATAVRTPEQAREDRNACRRAKRLAERRARFAKHAAFVSISYGRWENGLPVASPASVASKATGMYHSYLKGVDITVQEGESALRYALETKGLPTGHLPSAASEKASAR